MKYSNIEKRIFNAKCPDHWLDEDTQHPNDIARNNALKICTKIYDKYKIEPVVIDATVESGIYIRYKKNNKTLIVECYNDCDIGCLVNDDDKKEILFNEDIDDIDFLFSDYLNLIFKGKTD